MSTRRCPTTPRTGSPARSPATHDEDTFRKWLTAHRPRMLSVAARYAHGSVGAEDIVQNASTAAYDALHTLEDPEAVGAWLAGFVRNVGAQEARKHARQSSLLEAYAATARVSDSRHSEEAILVKLDVRRAIDELPEIQRTVVICRWFKEMSHREIAATVGRLEGTVRSDLCRAHATLRTKLRELASD